MKYYGSILDFTHERNADLLRALREQLLQSKVVVMSDIFEKVAESPASRFWVSEERAAVVISAMLAHKPLPRMWRMKREMFEEIYRRFLVEKSKNPKASLHDLVAKVVNQPAPKFYLTPRTVGEYIYRIKSGWYDKQFDRYRHLSRK